MIDNRTPHYALPLPHPDNDLELDAPRLIAALLQLDTLLSNIEQAMTEPSVAERLATPRAINGVHFDGTEDITVEDSGAERRLPELPEGEQAAAYLTGARTWAPLAAAVLGLPLAGLAEGQAEPISAADTLLQALAKLQAQASQGGSVRPINDTGVIPAYPATVTIDVGQHEDSVISTVGAAGSGSLTVEFTNIPEVPEGSVVWYVEFIRGGFRTINWVLPEGLSMTWAGNVAPVLGTAATSRDMIMFERRLGRSKIVGTLIASGTV